MSLVMAMAAVEGLAFLIFCRRSPYDNSEAVCIGGAHPFVPIARGIVTGGEDARPPSTGGRLREAARPGGRIEPGPAPPDAPQGVCPVLCLQPTRVGSPPAFSAM